MVEAVANKNQENTEAMNTSIPQSYSPTVKSRVTAVQFIGSKFHTIWPFFLNTTVSQVKLIDSKPKGHLFLVDRNGSYYISEEEWLVKDDLGMISVMTDKEFHENFDL